MFRDAVRVVHRDADDSGAPSVPAATMARWRGRCTGEAEAERAGHGARRCAGRRGRGGLPRHDGGRRARSPARRGRRRGGHAAARRRRRARGRRPPGVGTPAGRCPPQRRAPRRCPGTREGRDRGLPRAAHGRRTRRRAGAPAGPWNPPDRAVRTGGPDRGRPGHLPCARRAGGHVGRGHGARPGVDERHTGRRSLAHRVVDAGDRGVTRAARVHDADAAGPRRPGRGGARPGRGGPGQPFPPHTAGATACRRPPSCCAAASEHSPDPPRRAGAPASARGAAGAGAALPLRLADRPVLPADDPGQPPERPSHRPVRPPRSRGGVRDRARACDGHRPRRPQDRAASPTGVSTRRRRAVAGRHRCAATGLGAQPWRPRLPLVAPRDGRPPVAGRAPRTFDRA